MSRGGRAALPSGVDRDEAGVAYQLDWRLVRGLDYYVRTTFEVLGPGLGSQSAIGAGGRYDGLVAQIGGPQA